MKKGNYEFSLTKTMRLIVGLSQKGAVSWACIRTTHKSYPFDKEVVVSLQQFLTFIIQQCGVEKGQPNQVTSQSELQEQGPEQPEPGGLFLSNDQSQSSDEQHGS